MPSRRFARRDLPGPPQKRAPRPDYVRYAGLTPGSRWRAAAKSSSRFPVRLDLAGYLPQKGLTSVEGAVAIAMSCRDLPARGKSHGANNEGILHRTES
jgi:hypothetical protein